MGEATILIVDDHDVVIQGIKSALLEHDGFKVVGEAHNGLQALELVESLKPDIVIMDISMPDLNGVEAAKKIKNQFPHTRIVIYTMYSNEEFVIELFKTGISGYVLKEEPFSQLILAINAAKTNGTYFSKITPKVLSDHLKALEERGKGMEALSLRERQIFTLLADGKSVKQIAKKLLISPKTVESHKYSIMAKLDAQTVTDLTKIAIKYKLIQIS